MLAGTNAFHVGASRDGEVVGSSTYEVSADGRALTVTAQDMRIALERK